MPITLTARDAAAFDVADFRRRTDRFKDYLVVPCGVLERLYPSRDSPNDAAYVDVTASESGDTLTLHAITFDPSRRRAGRTLRSGTRPRRTRL